MKKIKGLATLILSSVNIVIIVAMIATGMADHINPSTHPMMAVTGILYPLFLIANLTFIVIWIFISPRHVLIPVVGLVITYYPTRRICPLNISGEVPDNAIKVLSYNVFNFNDDGTGIDTGIGMAEYILENDADIVCLQEANPHIIKGKKADSILNKHYPHIMWTHKKPSGEWIGILSKHPIIASEKIAYESEGNISVAYKVQTSQGDITVINCHLESNKLNKDDKDSFRKIVRGGVNDGNLKQDSRKLLDKLAEAARQRAPQARNVAEYISTALEKGDDIILCGDFNDNPISYARRTISRNLTDCYIESATGPGISYNRNGMFVRIDNIMCSSTFTPCTTFVDRKIRLSDHFPIISQIKKKDKEQIKH